MPGETPRVSQNEALDETNRTIERPERRVEQQECPVESTFWTLERPERPPERLPREIVPQIRAFDRQNPVLKRTTVSSLDKVRLPTRSRCRFSLSTVLFLDSTGHFGRSIQRIPCSMNAPACVEVKLLRSIPTAKPSEYESTHSAVATS